MTPPSGQKWKAFFSRMSAGEELSTSALACGDEEALSASLPVSSLDQPPASIVLGPWRGAYTQRRAAELVGVPQSTLSRWVSGYWLADGRRSDPVLVRGATGGLSFLDVAELAVLASFRRAGVQLNDLRVAALTVGEFFGKQTHPFCAQKLLTDGNSVFARISEKNEHRDERLVDLVRRDMVIAEVIAPVLGQFEFDPAISLPRRWWPAGKGKPILIDPRIEHGEPVVSGSEIQTKVLYFDAEEGDSAQELADCYGLSANDVREAIDYERGLKSRAGG